MSWYRLAAEALERASEDFEGQATSYLQDEAADAGWPTEAAESVRVRLHDGHLSTGFHDSAFDWEFGTEDRPPAAVTRQWEHRLHEHSEHFDRLLGHHLRHVL